MRLARAEAFVKTANRVVRIARWTRLRRVILRCDPLPMRISNKRFTSGGGGASAPMRRRSWPMTGSGRGMDRPDVAIVGAGPYGLSIAAHLRAAGVTFRIFGQPMQTWREHMPDGMLLKADGFASNLADPASVFTLRSFCESAGIPYDDTRIPVRLETFRAYGLAYQQRMIPEAEDTQVVGIARDAAGFRLRLTARS